MPPVNGDRDRQHLQPERRHPEGLGYVLGVADREQAPPDPRVLHRISHADREESDRGTDQVDERLEAADHVDLLGHGDRNDLAAVDLRADPDQRREDEWDRE
jgi:hypothetical protein